MQDRYKILVINRDAEWLGIIKQLQDTEPYQIDITQSGVEAFEKVKADKYHIILMDIDIPDYNGIRLLEEMKQYDSLAQIIVTTRQSTMEKILGSLEGGANDYIAPPNLRVEELAKRIHDSIDKLERWRNSILDLVKELAI
jgi:DNA-binding response OmpR family regulator